MFLLFGIHSARKMKLRLCENCEKAIVSRERFNQVAARVLALNHHHLYTLHSMASSSADPPPRRRRHKTPLFFYSPDYPDEGLEYQRDWTPEQDWTTPEPSSPPIAALRTSPEPPSSRVSSSAVNETDELVSETPSFNVVPSTSDQEVRALPSDKSLLTSDICSALVFPTQLRVRQWTRIIRKPTAIPSPPSPSQHRTGTLRMIRIGRMTLRMRLRSPSARSRQSRS